MEKEVTYQMNGRVVLRHIGEDHLLVPIQGDVAQENCVFPVNETGVFLWKQLISGASPAVAAEALSRTFDVTPETAVSDTQEFVAELLDRQLIEEAGA